MASEWAMKRASREDCSDAGGYDAVLISVENLAELLDEAYKKGAEEMHQIVAQKESTIAAMKEALSRQRMEVASIKKHGACPYVVSSAEGTQSCRLNGALESVLEAIEKDLDSFGYATYEMTSFRNASDGRSYQFGVTFGESIVDAHERVTFPKTSILEAATDCLEVIAEVLKRLER